MAGLHQTDGPLERSGCLPNHEGLGKRMWIMGIGQEVPSIVDGLAAQFPFHGIVAQIGERIPNPAFRALGRVSVWVVEQLSFPAAGAVELLGVPGVDQLLIFGHDLWMMDLQLFMDMIPHQGQCCQRDSLLLCGHTCNGEIDQVVAERVEQQPAVFRILVNVLGSYIGEPSFPTLHTGPSL